MTNSFEVVMCNARDVHKVIWTMHNSELLNICPWYNNEFVAILKITPNMQIIQGGPNDAQFVNRFKEIKKHVKSLECLTTEIISDDLNNQ